MEKIIKDENLLRDYKNFSRNKKAQTTATIINNLGNAVFGYLLASELDNADGVENTDIRDMQPLKTEEEAQNVQSAKGLKIMTPSQLITRLPILLAKLKVGNTSNKFKNELRQIIYSLYSSKNLTKTIYNHLINSI